MPVAYESERFGFLKPGIFLTVRLLSDAVGAAVKWCGVGEISLPWFAYKTHLTISAPVHDVEAWWNSALSSIILEDGSVGSLLRQIDSLRRLSSAPALIHHQSHLIEPLNLSWNIQLGRRQRPFKPPLEVMVCLLACV